MNTDPLQTVLDALTEHGCEPKRSGTGWAFRVPTRDDRRPSGSLSIGDDGRALIFDHGGEPTEAIVQAIGLGMADLMSATGARPPKPGKARTSKPKGRAFPTMDEAIAALERTHGPRAALWEYHDASGEPVGAVLRWNHPDGSKRDVRPVSRVAGGSAWRIGAMSEPRPLYRLPELMADDPSEPVWIAEGEKAAEALASCGLTATTSPGGAEAAGKSDWSALRGRSVVIVPDHDESGERYALDVARLATEAGASDVRIVRLVDRWPDLPPKGDAADLLAMVDDPADLWDDLRAMAAEAPGVRLDSIAPIGASPVQSNSGGYRLVPIGELKPAEEPAWVMPRYVAREHLTLLVGLWKGGKSTLLGHLLKDLYRGGGLANGDPVDWPTLVVSEESDGQWSKRRDELGLDPERIMLAKRPSFARPSMDDWLAMMAQLTDDVRRLGIGLVIFDTIANLWPLHDENDAALMGSALNPLKDLAAAGAAVVLVHHPKKADATEARVSRGSGALPAFVDAIVELRRTNPGTPGDRRRTLTGYGRWDIPAELVIELNPGIGYQVLGAPDELRDVDTRETILRLLPTDSTTAMTAAEIREAWPTDDRPSETSLRGSLVKGSVDGLWCKRGTGNRNDAFRFWLAPDKPEPARAVPDEPVSLF